MEEGLEVGFGEILTKQEDKKQLSISNEQTKRSDILEPVNSESDKYMIIL